MIVLFDCLTIQGSSGKDHAKSVALARAWNSSMAISRCPNDDVKPQESAA
jgi:hypothetical protein